LERVKALDTFFCVREVTYYRWRGRDLGTPRHPPPDRGLADVDAFTPTTG
jgi:hypothetical protein